jgi:hypothetical protein
MKTIATRINPAFKVAQPLPLWPVALPSQSDAAAAGPAAARRSPNAAPQEMTDRAAFVLLPPGEHRSATLSLSN